MIEYPPLMPYVERYAGLRCEPLVIRLYLEIGSQLAGYDPLHLDNLLARCVVNEATEWEGLSPENGQEGYLLPVPLARLWVNPRGYPLWAATPFQPGLGAEGDVQYWHKRRQTGRWTRTARGTFSMPPARGRWMERRVPVPTVVAPYWEATCVGNAREIARLLEQIRYAGKRRSVGLGAVHHWEIAAASEGFALVRNGRLTRPLPALAVELLDGAMPVGAPAPVGWTPPQWQSGLWAPGWWAGTEVTHDWFTAATHLSAPPDERR